MPSEIERKYLVKDDAWKDLPREPILQIEQGYIPRYQQDGLRLYITFPTDPAIIAQFTIETDTQTYVFDGIAEDEAGDFQSLQALDNYNPERCELALIGSAEARVRIQESETGKQKVILAVKDYKDGGRSNRGEFEVDISLADAHHIVQHFINGTIKKERIPVIYHGQKWEVDRYLGENEGLVTVDVEVVSQEKFDTLIMLPSAGEDITDVHALQNDVLIKQGIPAAYKRSI